MEVALSFGVFIGELCGTRSTQGKEIGDEKSREKDKEPPGVMTVDLKEIPESKDDVVWKR